MQTIEASILVPLGLGLISLLLMLTFFLHDQTVLTAEYASTVLEWQMSPGKWDEEECKKEAEQWSEGLLITDVQPVRFSAGKILCALQTREEYRIFGNALSLLEQSFPEDNQSSLRLWVKTDPCWIKRVWKVVSET